MSAKPGNRVVVRASVRSRDAMRDDVSVMVDRRRKDVISNLPRHRPHRRSDKRGAPAPPPDGSPEASAAGRPATPATAPKPRSAGRGKRPAAAKPAGSKQAAPRKAAAKRTASAPAVRTAAKTAKPPPSAGRERIGATAGAKTRAERIGPAAGAKTSGLRPAPEPPPERPSGPLSGGELVGTVVQAAGELGQIGLTLGAQAVKNAVKKLPKP